MCEQLNLQPPWSARARTNRRIFSLATCAFHLRRPAASTTQQQHRPAPLHPTLMSSFVTLPTRLAAQWGASSAPAESLHVNIAVSGVTDPGGAKCKVNQDTFFTHCDATNGAMVIGVFDGHGKEAGRDAAFAARDYFKAHFQSMTQQDYQQMEQRPQQVFSSMFNECHSAMKSVLKAVYERRGFTVQEQDGYMVKLPTGVEATQQQQQLYSCVRGGTTATIVVILDGGRKILTANVGDSAVAIGAKRVVCMKQSDLLELLDEEATEPGGTGKSDTTTTKLNHKANSTTKLLMLTGDHSPDNQREFFRARDFRRSDSDHSMPGLRFLFDTGDPRAKRKPIYKVDVKGELTQKGTGDYLKNVRDEWATLVATPADSPFPDSLAFTRSLGDFHMHAYGVSCEPSVRELSLEQIAQRAMRGSSRSNQEEHDDDFEAASASNTESDDNNSETSMHDCNGHGGAIEFTLVAASDGVWDNWKFNDLFEFLDNSDAKRTRARSTSSTSSSTKSDVAGGNDELPEAYPVDNAVAMLLKANFKLAQRVFGDDADNMTAVLCHFRVSS